MANIDPFGKLMQAERWISQDKLNRQQMARQNALQDIQQQSAQLGLEQRQGDAAFRNMLATNPQQAKTNFKLRYDTAYPQASNTKPVFKDLGKGSYGEAGLYDVSGQSPRYIGASTNKTPLVSIGGDKQESEFGKTMGKGLATQFLDMQKDSAAAGTTKYRYRRAGQLVKSLATGATKPAELTAKRLAKSLGLDITKLGITDDVSGAEALKAMGIDLTMDVVQRTKGAVSNKEMDLFAQTAPGLGNTLEGNIIILEMADKMATLKQQIGKLSRDYKSKNKGKFDEGFYDELDKFHKENPLFTGDIQARIDSIGGTRESMQIDGETAILAEDGNYYINRNGEYYMVEE